LEAGAPKTAAIPSPSNAHHDPQDCASPPMLIVAAVHETAHREIFEVAHCEILQPSAEDKGQDEGSVDGMARRTQKKKKRKSNKVGGPAKTAADDLGLPQTGWQDLEAGASERPAGPNASDVHLI